MARPRKNPESDLVNIVDSSAEIFESSFPTESDEDVSAEETEDMDNISTDEGPQPISLRESMQSELREIELHQIALTKRQDELTKELDALIAAEDGNVHPHENQLAIQAAIARSNEMRIERAARIKSLIDKGVDPHEIAISPRSPLDAAIAQNVRSKAVKRPQFKPVTT